MKINWKKMMVAISLGIGVFACAGCDGKKTTEVKENRDTLKICVESYFEQDMKILIDAWEYFNKGVKAELVVIPRDRDEAEIKVSEIRTEILAGGGPDVFLMYNRDPLLWLDEPTPSLFPNPEKAMHTGVFLPLDSYMENARYYNPEHYNQIIMEAGKTEEGQCLLPLTYEYRVCYLEEPQENPIQMPLPSWESLVSGEAGIPSTMIRFVNYSFFDLLGEYADYANKKMLISEEELYEYVLEAIDYGKLAENGPEAEGMVWAEETCASEVLKQPSDFMQNSNSFLALPNRDGGINANISFYVGINKNTTKPSQAFSFLDLLLSDEIMTYSGFWVEEENKFKGSGVLLDSFGVSVNEKEFEIWCKLLPDDTEKAFRELNSQISSVHFYSDLDLELQNMRDKCREADGGEGMKKYGKQGIRGLLFTAPVMLGCMVFYAIPFFMVVWYSFRSGMGGQSVFTGLENYRSVLENPVFQLAAGNTLKFFLIGLPLILILAYGIALLLKSQVQKFIFMKPVLLFPYIMPVTGTVLLADVFFSTSEPGLESILVLYLWKNTGYSMILLLAGLMTIPQEQYNCAKLDGAGEIQMFFYITTPQMWYSLFFTFLFSMINGFKCFREIFLLGGEHPGKQVYMLQHYLNNNFESLNYRNLSAVSVLLFLVITLVLGLAYVGVLGKEAYKS